MDPKQTPVSVEPVTPERFAAVRTLRVNPDQERYSGSPALTLAAAVDDPHCEPMAILADGEVVGFYRLEFAAETIVGARLGATHVGVRAFMIDARHQGSGYGTRAVGALCTDLQQRHPQRRLAVLLVHCRNRAGIAIYRRGGFVDTGQLFAGGHAGPQQLMLRTLVASPAGGVGQ
jgi:RimJ/RimL family protein N-acetyltransferase